MPVTDERFFPLLIDRWVGGTRHMKLEEVGMYIQLLVYLYEKPERYLKDADHIARILHIRPQQARRIWPQIAKKFHRNQHGYTHVLVRKLRENSEISRGFERVLEEISLKNEDLELEQHGVLPLVPRLNPVDPREGTKEKEKVSLTERPKRKRKVQRFVKPSVDEVQAYCDDRKNGIDAEEFVTFYESKGWMVGSSPMKSWQAAVRTWEQKRKQQSKRGNSDGKEQPVRGSFDWYDQRSQGGLDTQATGRLLEGDGGVVREALVRRERGES